MAQIFHKIQNYANNRQKKQPQQRVTFFEDIKTHEYSMVDEEPEHNSAESSIAEILAEPFDPPKTGYMMGINSAASMGMYELVEHFIYQNVNFVNSTSSHGWTPLMYAAQSGNYYVCQLLLYYGAKVELKNDAEQTALDLALNWGHPYEAQLLQKGDKYTWEQHYAYEQSTPKSKNYSN